ISPSTASRRSCATCACIRSSRAQTKSCASSSRAACCTVEPSAAGEQGGKGMANIAFVGLGNMGAPMAANLVKAGHEVTGYDLVEAQCAAAAANGVAIARNARAAVEGAEAIVTMLPAGRHVIACWSDILPAVRRGALVIDSST